MLFLLLISWPGQRYGPGKLLGSVLQTLEQAAFCVPLVMRFGFRNSDKRVPNRRFQELVVTRLFRYTSKRVHQPFRRLAACFTDCGSPVDTTQWKT